MTLLDSTTEATTPDVEVDVGSATGPDTPGDAVTVLMTGTGAPGASGIVRALRRAEDLPVHIVGVDMDPEAYGFTLVDEAETVPAAADEDYLPTMLSLAERVEADVVLPLTTAELGPLAANKRAFESIGASVLVSDESALSVANDKGELYERVAMLGQSAGPDFCRVSTREEFVDAVYDLGYPEETVCFKPPVGSGMRGFRVLDPDTDRLDILMNSKPDGTVTTLEDILPVLESAETFPDLVVMEYLPGEEYSVDALVREDDVPVVVPRTRAKTRAGISFGGTVERNEELMEISREICSSLDLEYNVNLQFRYDADGTPKLIEINPRVSGTIVMCLGAGANMPALAVRHALGRDLPDVDVAWGTKMARYWQEVFYGPDTEPFTL